MPTISSIELSIHGSSSLSETRPFINQERSCWGRCFSRFKSHENAKSASYMLCTGFVMLTIATALVVANRNTEDKLIEALPLVTIIGIVGFVATVGGTLAVISVCHDVVSEEES